MRDLDTVNVDIEAVKSKLFSAEDAGDREMVLSTRAVLDELHKKKNIVLAQSQIKGDEYLSSLVKMISAMTLESAKDENNAEYHVLRLPYGYVFPNTSKVGGINVVFVRKSYEPLFGFVEQNRAEQDHESMYACGGFLLTGNTGIGKSVGALNYFLWRYAQMKKFVVLEAVGMNKTFCFDFANGTASSYSGRADPGVTPELENRETIYLVDPSGKNLPREPIECCAFTLLFSSPAKEQTSQFVKRHPAVLKRFIGVWDKEELLQLASCLRLDKSIVSKHIAQLGCIPRLVLRGVKVFHEAELDQKAAIHRLKPEIFDELRNTFAWTDVVHHLFHIVVTEVRGVNAFLPSEIVWASKACEDAVMEKFREFDSKSLESIAFVEDPLTKKVAHSAFEAICHYKLRRGGEFEIRFFDEPGEDCRKSDDNDTSTVLTLTPSKVETCDIRQRTTPLKSNVLYVPKSLTEAGVDSFSYKPTAAFQCTTQLSPKDILYPKKVVDLLQCDAKDKMKLYYVVPDYLYPNFRPGRILKEQRTMKTNGESRVKSEMKVAPKNDLRTLSRWILNIKRTFTSLR